jgi:diphthamide biosynthesis protein 3
VSKLETAATIYTPEAQAALSRYQQHMRETKSRLDERRELAIEELERYGDTPETAGTDTMAEIARRYGSLAKEVETVRMEIARLVEGPQK